MRGPAVTGNRGPQPHTTANRFRIYVASHASLGYSPFMSIERILTIVVLVLGAIALIIWILANI